jgi:MoxR-like ATPase
MSTSQRTLQETTTSSSPADVLSLAKTFSRPGRRYSAFLDKEGPNFCTFRGRAVRNRHRRESCTGRHRHASPGPRICSNADLAILHHASTGRSVMTTPFVTTLRSRPSTIHLTADGADAITIRVEMPEVWDVVAIVVAPTESVVRVKQRALEALFPEAQTHADFVVKLRGWEILDENASLADAGVIDGSILLLTHRRRRAVHWAFAARERFIMTMAARPRKSRHADRRRGRLRAKCNGHRRPGAARRILMSLIAGGHAACQDLRNALVRSLAEAVHLEFRRIQFTRIVPSDSTSSRKTRPRARAASLRADRSSPTSSRRRINRAPPRTQAALLEGDAEHSVTAAAKLRLPEPFLCCTQNPIEQEGTYPLPEAQLDRFLFDIRVGYPKEEEEIAILRSTTGAKSEGLGVILGAAELIALQRLTRDITAADSVLRYAASLVRATRPDDERAPDLVKRYVRWGAGPRAGQSLILGAKAHALLAGRLVVSPNDIKRVVLPVLRHRVLPNFAAEAESVSVERIIEDLVARIEPPRSEIRV